MSTLAQLLIGGVGILTGLLTARRAFTNYRVRDQIAVTNARDLEPGKTVTLTGTGEACDRQVTGPVSGAPGVAVALQIEKRSGTGAGWQTTELHARGIPFRIRDHAHGIEIDASNISFETLVGSDSAQRTESFEKGATPPQLWEGVDRPDKNSERRYTEVRFEEEELTAVGEIESVTAGATACEDVSYRLDPGAGTYSRLTDYTPDDLKEQYGWVPILKPAAVAIAAFVIAAIFIA